MTPLPKRKVSLVSPFYNEEKGVQAFSPGSTKYSHRSPTATSSKLLVSTMAAVTARTMSWSKPKQQTITLPLSTCRATSARRRPYLRVLILPLVTR